MATLTVKVIEEITLNNNSYNSERSLDISSVNENIHKKENIAKYDNCLSIKILLYINYNIQPLSHIKQAFYFFN